MVQSFRAHAVVFPLKREEERGEGGRKPLTLALPGCGSSCYF